MSQGTRFAREVAAEGRPSIRCFCAQVGHGCMFPGIPNVHHRRAYFRGHDPDPVFRFCRNLAGPLGPGCEPAALSIGLDSGWSIARASDQDAS